MYVCWCFGWTLLGNPLGLSYFSSFVKQLKDLINGRARPLTVKIISSSDMSGWDREIYLDSAIFLGSFFPLASPLLFLLPPHWELETFSGKRLDVRFG